MNTNNEQNHIISADPGFRIYRIIIIIIAIANCKTL